MHLQSTASDLSLKTVGILGAACGRGARDERCQYGPIALRAYGLVDRLQARGIDACWRETLAAVARGAEVAALDAVAGLCQRLARRVEELVARQAYFAVVGGDHSCAVGTWSGAARALGNEGSLGLVWIDAHMDGHVPETSTSGTLHGMGLAALLGFGERPLTGIAAPGPALLAQHLSLIGVRSFEAEEAALLGRLGVRVFFMEEVARRGLEAVLDEALRIAKEGTAGFGLSVDLDALDPNDAPGVGSPEPGGLGADRLVSALRGVSEAPGFLGVEIAEFNPTRDRDNVTARVVQDLLAACVPPEGGP